MDYLAQIKEFHRQAVEPYLGKPRGSGEDEVRQLERQCGFDLPLAYRQYLLWMGNDYEGIFRGSSWFLKDALPNTAWLPQLLDENHIQAELPPHYLAFFDHQGYNIAWFALPPMNDDPPVWYFGEGQNMDAPKLFESFTIFLDESMRGNAAIVQRNLETYGPTIIRRTRSKRLWNRWHREG